MPADAAPAQNVDQIAAALRVSIGLLVRRLRQIPVEGDLTLSETSALARLDRGGPTTPGALAKRSRSARSRWARRSRRWRGAA